MFQSQWWLDTVAPGQWDEIRIEEGGRLVARLAFVLDTSGPVLRCGMPPLSQTLGPWIEPGEGKLSVRMEREIHLMERLIDQLPQEAGFNQNFHWSITNWLPFYWAGFKQTTRYTYRIDGRQDLESVWSQVHSRTRNQIRNAEKELTVVEDLGAEAVMRLCAMTFERQGRTFPTDREIVVSAIEAAIERGSGRSLFAVDADNRVHATAFFLWDSETVYYLLGGADPELRNSNAQGLLIWECIRFAIEHGLAFDFEGSMHRPIEHSFRAFGAVQTPYFQVWKDVPPRSANVGLLSRLKSIVSPR